MEIYSENIAGKKIDFQVVKNLTRPCYCGVPACGKENILWYEYKGKYLAFIFDGSLFDSMGMAFFKQNKVDYKLLPEFMQEWYESSGWEDSWDCEYILDIDDFLKSLNLMKPQQAEDWLQADMKAYLSEMKSMALNAKKYHSPLKILRG